MIKKIKELITFLSTDIWRITSGSKLFFILKAILLCFQRKNIGKLSTASASLTLKTAFSIVPLIALIFAISKGFGVTKSLESMLREQLHSPDNTLDYIFTFAENYLNSKQNGIFLGIGIVILLWAVTGLLNRVEAIFNSIWEVNFGRTIFRKVTDYLSITLLVPILLIASSGVTVYTSTLVDSATGLNYIGPILKFALSWGPYVILWLALALLYWFMPNTNVRFKHALIAGIVAGSAIQLFQYLYIHGQVALTSYSKIYGGFAAIPLFLFWLQISWSICLVGVRLSYALQNVENFEYADDVKKMSRRYSDFMSVAIFSLIVERFVEDKRPYTLLEITQKHNIPLALASKITSNLMEVGLIHDRGNQKEKEARFYPSFDVSNLTVGMVLERLDTNGSEVFDLEGTFPRQWKALVELREEGYNEQGGILIKELHSRKDF